MRFSTTLLLPLLTLLPTVLSADAPLPTPAPSVILSTSTRTVVYVTTEIVTGTPPANPQNTTSTIKPSVGTNTAYSTGFAGTNTGAVVSPSIQPVGNGGVSLVVGKVVLGVVGLVVGGFALC